MRIPVRQEYLNRFPAVIEIFREHFYEPKMKTSMGICHNKKGHLMDYESKMCRPIANRQSWHFAPKRLFQRSNMFPSRNMSCLSILERQHLLLRLSRTGLAGSNIFQMRSQSRNMIYTSGWISIVQEHFFGLPLQSHPALLVPPAPQRRY